MVTHMAITIFCDFLMSHPQKIDHTLEVQFFFGSVKKWVQRPLIGAFIGSIHSLHLRFMRVSYGTSDGVAVRHFAPFYGAGGVARFGLGSNPINGGYFGLADRNTLISVTPSQSNTYYEIRMPPPIDYWWYVMVGLPPSGGTQDLDEVRFWEFIDIEPYLEELIPADADTEVFQMPFGRYFVGTHYRWTSKRLTLTLLLSRTEVTLRKQLEGLLTKPSARYPLELFVDGYLFRCAPASLRFEPVGGLVVRAVIELTLLQPYGYHQDRQLIVSSDLYPSEFYSMTLPVDNQGSVETPCEIRIAPGSVVSGYKIRVTVSPHGQSAIYTMAGDESGKLISFQENGRVLIGSRNVQTVVTDVTDRLDISSLIPFVLQPGLNMVFVDYLDSNNNPINDTSPWQIAVAFNPRIGEVVGL